MKPAEVRTSAGFLFFTGMSIPKDALIYVAGSTGMVGSAIVRNLRSFDFTNIITSTRAEVDLTNQREVEKFFKQWRPEYVYLAAAKVGGIIANITHPAQFAYDNLMIEANVINAAFEHRARKLLFLGSSCIYPRNCSQPIKEEYLLTSELESTNRAYAVAKIAGIELCRSYKKEYGFNCVSVMPTNLYGPGDNYHPTGSHVIPGLIRKFHEAKVNNYPSVTCWGNGTPFREFLHVDDLALACIMVMDSNVTEDLVNIGCGEDLTIADLAKLIKDVVGYKGDITWDTNKPNGTPRKLLDITKIKALGWRPRTSLSIGLTLAYMDFLRHQCPPSPSSPPDHQS